MLDEPGAQNSHDEPGIQVNDKRPWLIAVFVLVSLILVGILVYAILSSTSFITEPGPNHPSIFIDIITPGEGDLLDLTWAVNVSGQAGGLFEGSVVIQAIDAAGNVLAQQFTTIDVPGGEVGGTGTWAVDVRFHAEPGTQGQIIAFSPSPVDGSIIAEDSINVGFGESYGDRDLVTLEDHFWKLHSLQGNALINDSLLTLQFNNFQASGSGGCNRFNTSYERQGVNLNFGFVTSTAKECEQPHGIMNQEAAYFDALEKVNTYRIESQQLKMYDVTGDSHLVYGAVVQGTISNGSELDIPKDAAMIISLHDRNLIEGEAQSIAEQNLTGMSEFPIPFILAYNPREIAENHTYSIEVRIEDIDGNLLYTNPGSHLILTGGHPSQVEVIVDLID